MLCVERESHGTVLDIEQIRQLLTSISSATPPSDNSPDDAIDHSLDSLSINDFTALQKAADRLTTKTKDKTLDVLLRLRVTAMLGTINVTTFPPSDLSDVYRRLHSQSCPYSRFVNHVTFPSIVILLFIITCRRGSSSSLSRTLTHYAYLLISDALYDT